MSFMKSAQEAAMAVPIKPGMTAPQLARAMFDRQQECFDGFPIGPALHWDFVDAATRAGWIKLAESRIADLSNA